MKIFKIAFLNKYQSKVNRGAETFVREVARRLSQKYRVDIIADINYLDLLRKRYDLVVPTNGRFQVILIRFLTWLTNTKMIVSGQSGKGWDDRVNLYSFPDCFVAISTPALRWAKKINPFVKSVYIPNGVDIDKFRPTGEKINTNLKKPIILCVGAFTKEKRIDLVIKAVAQIENASLLLVGKGKEENNLRDLGFKLLFNRFEIRSFPYEEMPKVYRVADLFTLVSAPFHSFENVLVEAMATNLPVVANNDLIREEIVGNAGFLVDPNKTSRFAKVLEKALSSNWKDKPRNQAKKFDWDQIAQKYDRIIQNL